MTDTDFEQFIQILDGALASKDPKVKNALRKFLFVAALAMGDDMEPGPFTEMMETINELQQRISTLESQARNDQYTTTTTTEPSWYKPYYYPVGPGGCVSTGGDTWFGSTSSTATGTYTNWSATYTDMLDPGTQIKDSINEKLDALLETNEKDS